MSWTYLDVLGKEVIKRIIFTKIKTLLKKFFLGLIKLYQKAVSPALPASCRFYPTCSEYNKQAIERYGPIKGLYLGIKRILRCHPLNPGGYDPVPGMEDEKDGTEDEGKSKRSVSDNL